MRKRPAFDLKALLEKKARTDERVASQHDQQQQQALPSNPFLSQPVNPKLALQIFLTQMRNAARKYLPAEYQRKPITKPFCEVEAPSTRNFARCQSPCDITRRRPLIAVNTIAVC